MLRNYAKSCLKRKMLVEILIVAKKLASNFWKALGRRWGGGGGVGRLLNKALFLEASPRGPVPFVNLPLKSCALFIYLLRENKSVRKEVFW